MNKSLNESFDRMINSLIRDEDVKSFKSNRKLKESAADKFSYVPFTSPMSQDDFVQLEDTIDLEHYPPAGDMLFSIIMGQFAVERFGNNWRFSDLYTLIHDEETKQEITDIINRVIEQQEKRRGLEQKEKNKAERFPLHESDWANLDINKLTQCFKEIGWGSGSKAAAHYLKNLIDDEDYHPDVNTYQDLVRHAIDETDYVDELASYIPDNL